MSVRLIVSPIAARLCLLSLFAGNDDGARTRARCASLIGACKLNGVSPRAYLTDTLRRIVDVHTMSRIEDPMPWNFTPTLQSPAVDKDNRAALTVV